MASPLALLGALSSGQMPEIKFPCAVCTLEQRPEKSLAVTIVIGTPVCDTHGIELHETLVGRTE